MTGTEALMIVGMACVTFLIRYPIMELAGRVQLPARLIAALRYVPLAVLTAIIVPGVVFPDGKTAVTTLFSPYVLAAVITVGVMWFSKNMLLTILLGMGSFLLLRAVM